MELYPIRRFWWLERHLRLRVFQFIDLVLLIGFVWGACMESTQAETSQDGCVIASIGEWASNSTFNLVYTSGQPGTTGVSTNDRLLLYAGFLGGAFIRPSLLSVHGVPVEADPDNDGDLLEDAAEVSGDAFNGYATTDPNNPDTDSDGMSDYAEAIGMFDPNDDGHVLQIRALQKLNENEWVLEWVGRGGGTTNMILSSYDLLAGGFTNVLLSTNVTGGMAPWYKMTNSYSWFSFGITNRFFLIKSVRE